MKTRWIAILLLCSAFAAGYALQAQQQQTTSSAYRTKELNVPKNYGTFKGVYADQLLFEDDRGIIRSVYPNGGFVVFQVTRR